MKILLLGKNGQVGWELQRTMAPLGEITAVDLEELDLADVAAIRKAVRDIKPDLIVNAAAYTAVDKAEEEPDLAMAINGTAPGVLAEEAGRMGAGIIHYSTDYVFAGTKKSPYTEEDATNPLGVYGETKLAGERAVAASGAPYLILRTSWVYGTRGKNFLLTILRLAHEREELRVVDDQIGAPTWSRMIAEATALIAAQGREDIVGFLREKSGIYNFTAAEKTSWYGFAKAITELNPHREKQTLKSLTPIPTSEYPTPAKRPANSVLAHEKLIRTFGIEMPDWDVQLKMAMEE